MSARLTVGVLAGLMLWVPIASWRIDSAIAADDMPFQLPEQGLVVHQGTTDGLWEMKAAHSGTCLVHGLTLDAEAGAKARRLLVNRKVYGIASVDFVASFERLPYADRIVNALVADLDALQQNAPSDAEMKRVLAPFGTLIVRRNGKWSQFNQPLPEAMDTWTHWDHGPDGNPVSKDRLVGPTTSLRWLAGPVRGMHDALAGVRLHQGRIVYTSPTESSSGRGVEDERTLCCRDAFNGLLLWKRRVAGLRNRFAFIADQGHVYTIVDDGGPVEALDIRTGETKVKFTGGTTIPPSKDRLDRWRRRAGGLELPLSASHFVLRRFDDKLLQAYGETIDVFEVDTGKLVWSFRDGVDKPVLWCVVGEAKVFAITSSKPLFPTRGSPSFLVDSIVALDADSGEVLWRQHELAGRGIYRMVYADGHLVIPSFQADGGNIRGGYRRQYQVHKLRGDTGQIVWTSQDGLAAAGHYEVAMVKDDHVFVGNQAGFALDWNTGKPVAEKLNWGQYDAGCSDLRGCPGFTFYGLTFIDDDQRVITRGQARSSCDVGNFPGYGLIYSQPSHCLCSNYVNGHLAMAAEPPWPATPDNQRLQSGPGKAGDLKVDARGWPTHLGNAERGAYTAEPAPRQLNVLWQAELQLPDESFLAEEWKQNDFLAGIITAPTVGDGRVFVAVPDLHRLEALDTATGKELWSFIAGGRIDSSPTLAGSLAIFGCRDGWVYALRADSGELVWKFQAAVADKRILVRSQLESAWPVVGSVLLHHGEIICTAGRQSALDEGLHVYRLDPATGKMLGKTRIWTDPDKQDPFRKGYQPNYRRIQDLLVSDGRNIHATIDTMKDDYETGEIVELAPQSASDRGGWVPKEGDQMPWLWANSNGFLGRSTESQGRWDAAPMVYARLQGRRFVIAGDRLYMFKVKGSGIEAWTRDAENRPSKLLWETNGPPIHQGRELAAMIGADDRLLVAIEAGTTTQLHAISMRDGKPLGEWSVPHPPLRDGLAVADGKLILSTSDGRVLCLGEDAK